MFRQQVLEDSRKGMFFLPVSQRAQKYFTFTDNVRTSVSFITSALIPVTISNRSLYMNQVPGKLY
jgi:hypothetical protein